MKGRTIFFVISCVLFVVGLVLIVISANLFWASQTSVTEEPEVARFNLSEYAFEIADNPSDEHVAPILDAEDAIEKARELWAEKYGDKYGDPTGGRRVKVEYAPEADCWHVYGTLFPFYFGYVPHAFIQSDGEVLALWYIEG